MLCEKCGAQLREGAKFCDVCGTQTATEQTNIQEQMLQKRRENPAPYIKNAVIITAILFGSAPLAYLLTGDLLAVWIGLIVAGVFSALSWILGIIQQNKYKKGTGNFDISRKR